MKLDAVKKFLFNLRDIRNGKNKGELVECRLCLEDTICHASLFHELYYWFRTIWLFSLTLSVLTIHSVARKSSIVFANQGYWIFHCSPAFGFVRKSLLLRLVKCLKKSHPAISDHALKPDVWLPVLVTVVSILVPCISYKNYRSFPR